MQAVVLAHRPPISIPQTTVSPALLEELLGEISSLASVYHKPEETFIGGGRVGADSVQRKENESVLHLSLRKLVPLVTTLAGSRMISFRRKRRCKRLLLVSKQRTSLVSVSCFHGND